jgi:hypothetical protein
MFEDANLFIGLDDASPDARLETVEKLRSSVRSSGSELPVHNLTQLFQLMSDRLKDEDHRVALMSAELLCDLLNRDLLTTDIYFPIVLPAMFQNLANDRRRDSSVYVLTTYVEAMGGADCILEGMVQHGLMHDKAKVREQTLLTLPTIVEGYLVPSASAGREDYMKLLDELCLCLNDNDSSVVEAAGHALRFAKSEDKNFLKHVATLGQPTLDLVTSVIMDQGTSSRSNTNIEEAEAKEQQTIAEFETKDTIMMNMKQEEKDAMSAVAELDKLVQQERADIGSSSKNSSINTRQASSMVVKEQEEEVDEEDVLFSRDQKQQIDRIRAGKDDRISPSSMVHQSSNIAQNNDNESTTDSIIGNTLDHEISANNMNDSSSGSGNISSNASSGSNDDDEIESTIDDVRSPIKQQEESKTSKNTVTNAIASSIASTAGGSGPTVMTSPIRDSQRIDIASNETDRVNSIQKGREAYSERHGEERNAPIAGGVVNLVYGLIYEPTMENLRNQSSWKLRASAIEEVLATVTEMSESDVRLVRPHIPELFKVSNDI